MIKFDPNKEKKINFTVNVQGIDPEILEYNIRLSTGKVDYGFKGSNNNGKLSFVIPPLNEVINSDLINSLNTIRIEVNDLNNKYYLKPFEDHVKIDQSLKMEAQLSEEENISKEKVPDVDIELNEDEDKVEEKHHDSKEKKKEEKKKKKSTKLSKYLKD